MSLDFVIAEGKFEAQRKPGALQMEEKTHSELMLLLPAKDFPMMNRIRSFYDDAIYQGGDVAVLLQEINVARKKIKAPMLDMIARVCEEAINLKCNIYAFGD